jgi:hypothetical protein
VLAECVEKDTIAADALADTFTAAEEERRRPGTFEQELAMCDIMTPPHTSDCRKIYKGFLFLMK